MIFLVQGEVLYSEGFEGAPPPGKQEEPKAKQANKPKPQHKKSNSLLRKCDYRMFDMRRKIFCMTYINFFALE